MADFGQFKKVGNYARIQDLNKKLKFVERILNKCIFHDLKINHVFITFYIFSLLFDINKYNKILQLYVIWLSSSVGRALV